MVSSSRPPQVAEPEVQLDFVKKALEVLAKG